MTSSGRAAAARATAARGASDVKASAADTSVVSRKIRSASGAARAFDCGLLFIGAAVKGQPVGEKILERAAERKDGSR